MRWSVGIEAEGDRVFSREEIVELADAVADSHGVATGIGTDRYGAQLLVVADSRDDAIAVATGVFRAAAEKAGLPAAPIVRTEAISEAEEATGSRRAAVIRLGSLAGYPFDGPRLLAAGHRRRSRRCTRSCTSPSRRRRTTRSSTSATPTTCPPQRFPFKHPRAACWIQRAGSKWKVYVCSYEVPGGTRAHREQIARELIAVYRPSCNEQQYDHAWKDEWIGEYSAAPTTAPVTRRGPDQRPG